MKLSDEDGELVLTPETGEERDRLEQFFGPWRKSTKTGRQEPGSGEWHGRSVERLKDGSVVLRISDAWWNYDSVY